MTIALGVILALVFLVLIMVFFMYNLLIGRKNKVEKAFATIDVMLKKRYDLIPNLVNTVKKYMKHEAGTLEQVTELRAKAMSGTASGDEVIDLNNKLNKMISGIMVAVEDYPDLKASENFMLLQRALNEMEEQLSASRRFFNAAITDFNNAVEMYPTNIMAGLMGYKKRQLFTATETERQNVNVSALFDS